MPSRDEGPAAGDEASRIVRSAATASNERNLTHDLSVVIVLGATATGKTALAVRLARDVGGEIVNADSRYLYRGMDVGTAKPTLADRQGISHHLIDIVQPTDEYSLERFLKDAFAAVEDVGSRGAVPIVAGGTPQYLKGLIEGWRSAEVAPDPALRARLEQDLPSVLHQRLLVVDPESAARIGPHNKRRMIRALEIHTASGRTMSELQGRTTPPYRFHLIGLRQPRELLYQRIDDRVRTMYAHGWLDEVRRLRESGVTSATPAMSAHGYREAMAVIDGTLTLDAAVEQTSRMVHRYVRHQETWFRKFPSVNWYDSSIAGYEAEVLDAARSFLECRPSADGDRLPTGA